MTSRWRWLLGGRLTSLGTEREAFLRPILNVLVLDVGWPAFESGFLIGEHGRRQWAGRTGDFGGLRKIKSNFVQADEKARPLLVVRSVSDKLPIRAAPGVEYVIKNLGVGNLSGVPVSWVIELKLRLNKN
ncbi:hypothetical protein TNCV_3886961 [Trichonephila clavipes]|nr:hypothetical protein TNCV_3886961 [Trichonephila clavipes]